MNVVDYALAIRIYIPIQPQGDVLHLPTSNQIIRQIQVGPTCGNFPGSKALAIFGKAVQRNHSVNGTCFAIVRTVFARQKETDL